MSLELIPVPIKLTPETIAILRSESELTGKHLNEIAREVLQAWADRQIHIANMRHKFLTREGFEGIDGSVTK